MRGEGWGCGAGWRAGLWRGETDREADGGHGAAAADSGGGGRNARDATGVGGGAARCGEGSATAHGAALRMGERRRTRLLHGDADRATAQACWECWVGN